MPGTNYPLEAIEDAVRALASLTLPIEKRIEEATTAFLQTASSSGMQNLPDEAAPHTTTIQGIMDRKHPINSRVGELNEEELFQFSNAFVNLYSVLLRYATESS